LPEERCPAARRGKRFARLADSGQNAQKSDRGAIGRRGLSRMEPTIGSHQWGRTLSVVSRLEKLCQEKGLKMTEQRRVIARVLSDAEDHPDVEQLYRRASKIDPGISLATVYRTVRLFEEANILERHDFGDGRARYEEAPENHHDHLIDLQSGQVIEFTNEEIEKLQHRVAEQLGYKLIGHRLELYATPVAGRTGAKKR
jgi:Fur family transcriptional regulator, ferric uptake regulator